MAQYVADGRAKCPHCQVGVRFEAVPWRSLDGDDFGVKPPMIAIGPRQDLKLVVAACPACGKIVVTAQAGKLDGRAFRDAGQEQVIWPFIGIRPPASGYVPADIGADYNESALVLSISPKASAALSRRCLQAVLRHAGYNQHDLAKQITAVLPSLPDAIAANVDAVRNVGNFAAHPLKSQASGEIIEVEAEEAEWNLDVLDALFDYYYIQPAIAQQRRDALNAKLAAAGKPPMK